MCTTQKETRTSFKDPGLIRVHQIHLSLFDDSFEIENRKHTHRFRYDEIEAMSTATVSYYINGQPQGISHTFRIWPRTETNVPLEFLFQQFPAKVERPKFLGVTVPFTQTHENPLNDPVFDDLIKRLSYQISLQMLNRIEQLGTTPWVPQVHLTNDGIVFAQKNQPELSCRFDQIETEQMVEDQWQITAPTSPMGDLQIGTASVNFYSGLRLFSVLRNLT